MSHLIYADAEPLLIKHDSCSNNPEKSYTEKKATHEACGYSMNVLRSYDKNIHSFYRGKDCIQKFCKELLDYSTKVVNIPKKPIIPLISDEQANVKYLNFAIYETKNLIMIKKINDIIITKTLKIMIITQENIEVQPIVYAI